MKGLSRLSRPMSILKRQISVESRIERTVEEEVVVESNFRTQLGSPATNTANRSPGGAERQPRPSASLADPLNWPRWKTELAYMSFLGAAGSSSHLKLILAPSNAVLSNEFSATYLAIVCLTGIPILTGAMVSVGGAALARLAGRRAVMLAGLVLGIAGAIWNLEVATSYTQFLFARVFQGVGWGLIDGVVSQSVEDLFFLVITLSTWSGPIVSGRVAEFRNWRKVFFVIGISQAFALLQVFFAAPETEYDRSQQRPVQSPRRTHKRSSTNLSATTAITLTTISSDFTPPEKCDKGYIQGLFFPKPSRTSGYLLPLKALAAPSTIIAFFLVGPLTAATYGLASSVALLFSMAPTLLKPQRIGYLFILPTGFAIAAHLIQAAFAQFRASRPSMRPKSRSVSLVITGQVLMLGAGGVVGLGLYTCAKLGPQMVRSSEVVSIVDGEMMNESRLWVVGGLLAAAAVGAVGVAMLAQSFVLSSFHMTRLLIDGRPEYVSEELEISRAVLEASKVFTNILAGAFTLAFPVWVTSTNQTMPSDALTGTSSISSSPAGPWKRQAETGNSIAQTNSTELGMGMLMGLQITSVALGIVILVLSGAAAVVLVSGADHLRRRDRKLLSKKQQQLESSKQIGEVFEMEER